MAESVRNDLFCLFFVFSPELRPTGFALRDYTLIADKTLADSVESIMGLFLVEQGMEGALRAMAFMGVDMSKGEEKWALLMTAVPVKICLQF